VDRFDKNAQANFSKDNRIKETEPALDVMHGNQFSFFCPKRFNRYPRFTIFFKRDRDQSSNPYIAENTVSLSPLFLSYLMDKNNTSDKGPPAKLPDMPKPSDKGADQVTAMTGKNISESVMSAE
jgi:hypothetical protein